MAIIKNEKKIEKEFHVSAWIIAYKMAFGILEAGLGIAIAVFGRHFLRIYRADVARELLEDPHDLLVRVSESIIPNLLGHNTLITAYLILLGVAKIAGAIGLINKQNWGVDLLVGLTVILLPFQLVSLIIHPSAFDAVYIVVGLLIALYLVEFKPGAWISRILSKAF